MKVYSELTDVNKSLSLALGVFDGVHKGHVEVIKSAVDFARQNSVKSAVITFKTHPQTTFNPDFKGCITTLDERIKIFDTLGVDFCYLLDFEQIKSLSGEEYLKEILIKNFAPVSISTGFNHHFGHNKSGTTELLNKMANVYNYKYFKIAPVIIYNETVSSSLIRKYLLEGSIESAEKFSDRPFCVNGIVVRGAGIASKIGFRTANLNYPKELIKLPFGVYSVNASFNVFEYKGIANFGVKPTVTDRKSPVLEVHLIDFDKNIYNENISIEFLKFIRPEKKFSNIEELKRQITLDIENM